MLALTAQLARYTTPTRLTSSEGIAPHMMDRRTGKARQLFLCLNAASRRRGGALIGDGQLNYLSGRCSPPVIGNK